MLVSVDNRRQPGFSGRGKWKHGGKESSAELSPPLYRSGVSYADPFSIRSKRVETGFDLASSPHTARYRDNAPAK
jgi:hypothetical protein